MSATLEFRHLALVLPLAQGLAAARNAVPSLPDFDPWHADNRLHLVFTEAGCSNVFDARNRVARDWQLAAVGTAPNVLSAAARVAADEVVGGGVCLRTRQHWTRPEAYIAAYRRALETALPYTALPASLQLEVNLTDHDQFLERWAGHARYREHLEACGALRGRTLVCRPTHTTDGLADLFWLATRAVPTMITGYVRQLRQHTATFDALHVRAQSRRRAAA
jgi:hypothetical protein